MELSQGILKAVESSYMQHYNNNVEFYLVSYKGKAMIQSGRVRLFKTVGAAKTFVNNFVKELYIHGEYWQSCAKYIKEQIGYDIDYSATATKSVKILDTPEYKKLFKELSSELLKQNIITIEKIK